MCFVSIVTSAILRVIDAGHPGRSGVGWWPGSTHVGPVGGLAFGLELEGLAGGVEQRECAAPGVGLDRAEDELAADALDLLADMDSPGVEVDVGPAQAQDFAAPQAAEDEPAKGARSTACSHSRRGKPAGRHS